MKSFIIFLTITLNYLLGQGLFFSEAAEGSSNNKYLEIYNNTGSNVDLSNYSLSSCSNGCDQENQFDYPDNVTFADGTILAANDVFVICHGSASDDILQECDQTFTYLSNGDEFFALTESGATSENYTIIDKIGEFGPDPGSGWDVAGVSAATKDHTLVRKSSVLSGNTNWNSSAGTNTDDSEWIVYDQNTWDHIGSHIIDAYSPNIFGIWRLKPAEGAIKVGPNPDDGSWWGNSEADTITRSCLWDDEYVFNGDGSFENAQGATTWLNNWQGFEPEMCGAPVYPHDGFLEATYDYNLDSNKITLYGLGAYLGLPRAITGGELSDDPAPDIPNSRTYDVLSLSNGEMKISIPTSGGYWTFTFVNNTSSSIVAGCTDSSAVNYNPDANYDDGSCNMGGSYLSGNVSGNWTLDNSPYYVTNNLVLQPNSDLTVEPGVEIIFEGNYRFDVFGKLTAVGDSTNYIKFTGNGNQWMSINFADASDDNSTLDYCIIENASESGYEPYYGAINFNQSNPTIKNSIIQNCSSHGIYLYYSNALIEKNLINNINNDGIYIDQYSQPEIISNTIHNTSIGLNVYGHNTLIKHNTIYSTSNYGLKVYEADNINIKSNEIYNTSTAIYLEYGSNYAVIDSNYIHDNGSGLYLNQYNNDLIVTNNIINENNGNAIYLNDNNRNYVIDHNTIKNNNGSGLNSNYASGGHIRYNLIANNNEYGIYLYYYNYGDQSYNQIQNNTIDNNGTGFYMNQGQSNTQLFNNSITNNTNYGIYCNGQSFSIKYNNSWNNSGSNYNGNLPTGTGNLVNINTNGTVSDNYYNISENPYYLNTSSGIYTLLENSPNIDAGDPSIINIDATVSDIGRYQTIQEVPIVEIVIGEGLENIETEFIKYNYADPSNELSQDRITDEIWITRGSSQGLFNAYTHSGWDWDNQGPYGTEWHWGPHSNNTDYSWTNWRDAVYQSGSQPRYALDGEHNGGPSIMTMRVINQPELIYEIVFNSWTCCGSGGGFSYSRTQVNDNGYTIKTFGEVAVDSSKSIDVFLSNIGYDDLIVDPITLNNTAFSASESDTIVIAPDSSKILNITFSPNSEGIFSDTLMINTNSVTNPYFEMPLYGQGYVEYGEIEMSIVINSDSNNVNTNFYDFGVVDIGDSSSIGLSIVSNGYLDVQIDSITSESGAFIIPDVSTTLPPGSNYDFEIVFAPIDAQSYSSDIIVHSSATYSNTVNLQGIGYIPYYGPTFHVSLEGNDASNGSINSPFETIQHAVNVANDGDTIKIGPGKYYQNNIQVNKAINFLGVGSMGLNDSQNDSSSDSNSLPAVTIIDGQNNYRIFSFNQSENIDSSDFSNSIDTILFSGIKIQNGYSNNNNGGGIYVNSGVNMKISGCYFYYNQAYMWNGYEGGAIYSDYNSSIVVKKSVFSNNSAYRGGGISTKGSNSEIVNNTFYDNSTRNMGGAIYADNSTLLKNNIFSNNQSNDYWDDHDHISGDYIATYNSFSNPFYDPVSNNSSYSGDEFITEYVMTQSDSSYYYNAYYYMNNGNVSSNYINTNTQATAFDQHFYNTIDSLQNILGIYSLEVWINFDGWTNENSIQVGTYIYYQYSSSNTSNMTFEPGFDNWEVFTLGISSLCIDAGDPNSPLDPDGTRADLGPHYFHQQVDKIEITAYDYNSIYLSEEVNVSIQIKTNRNTFISGIADSIGITSKNSLGSFSSLSEESNQYTFTYTPTSLGIDTIVVSYDKAVLQSEDKLPVGITEHYSGNNVYLSKSLGSDFTGNGNGGSPFLSLHRALRAIESGDTLSFNNGTYDAINESYNKVFSFKSNPGQDSVLINFNGSWVLNDSTGKDVNFIDIKTQNMSLNIQDINHFDVKNSDLGLSTVLIESGYISVNNSNLSGGGHTTLKADSNVNLISSEFHGITNVGIKIESNDLTIKESQFNNNSSVLFDVENSIVDTLNSYNGNGLYINTNNLISSNSSFSNNGTVNINHNNGHWQHSQLHHNYGFSISGNTEITHLSSIDNYGTFMLDDISMLKIDSSVFNSNDSRALLLNNVNNGKIQNSIFNQNSGGAIKIQNSSDIRLSKVYGEMNIAESGGLISLNNSSEIKIDSLLAFNNHSNGDGGAIFINNSNVVLDKSNIIFNSSEGMGGGIYINNSVQFPQFTNSIFWGNTSEDQFNQIHRQNGVLDVSYCNVQGDYNGLANINADPAFVSIQNRDFNLTNISPCINAGNPESKQDQDSSITDIGRYHYPMGQFVDQFGITSVSDVPNDNGGEVIVSWKRSMYDGISELYDITHYSIWRWNETSELNVNSNENISDVLRLDSDNISPNNPITSLPNQNSLNASNNSITTNSSITRQDVDPLNSRSGWEYIGDSPSQEFVEYSYIAPTLIDSSENGIYLTTFVVVAHTEDEDIYFVTDPDSGYSIDNLAPDLPQNFSASIVDSLIVLDWNSIESEDLEYFSIYRSISADFIPNSENLVVNTIDTSFTDISAEINVNYYYCLTAKDYNGNVTEPTLIVSANIDINSAPIIEPIENIVTDEDTQPYIIVNISDQNGDQLTINTNTSDDNVIPMLSNDTLNFSITENWFGNALITINVFDGELSDEVEFNIDILPINDAPQAFITLEPQTELSVAIIPDNLNENLIFTWEQSVDVDNDNILYSLIGSDMLDLITQDSIETEEYSISYNLIADYMLELGLTSLSGQWHVIASDGEFAVESSNTPMLTISMNVAPEIDPVSNIEIDEDNPYSFEINVSDANEDPLEISLQSSNENVIAELNDNVLNISTIENWYGNAEITISITDSYYIVEENFTINVSPINDSPQAFAVLGPESGTYISITEGNMEDILLFTWEQSIDVDDDTVYYSLIGTDQLEFFSIDSIIGEEYEISYQEIASIMQQNGIDAITGTWMISASDEEFVINSSNNSDLTIDATQLSVDNTGIPTVFALHQNYPNPFNPTTRIQYDMPNDEYVSINIYNLMGNKVKSFLRSKQAAGYKSIIWDATNDLGQAVSAGMYIYTIQAGKFRQTKKMLLLK